MRLGVSGTLGLQVTRRAKRAAPVHVGRRQGGAAGGDGNAAREKQYEAWMGRMQGVNTVFYCTRAPLLQCMVHA